MESRPLLLVEFSFGRIQATFVGRIQASFGGIQASFVGRIQASFGRIQASFVGRIQASFGGIQASLQKERRTSVYSHIKTPRKTM